MFVQYELEGKIASHLFKKINLKNHPASNLRERTAGGGGGRNKGLLSQVEKYLIVSNKRDTSLSQVKSLMEKSI